MLALSTKLGISRCTSWIYKRQRNQRSNCQHLLDHSKRKGVPGKHLLLLIDYAKAFDCVDHNKRWKILKELGIPEHLTHLLRNLLELDMEQRTGSNWERSTSRLYIVTLLI